MKNILLVFGGKSYEHDISVVTASQIYKRTKLENIRLIPFYISRQNKFFIYESDDFCISDFALDKFSKNKKKFREVCFVSNENNIIFTKTRFGLKEYLKADIAIFACHGASGENGKLVSIFENVNISSSAGNFDALAVCMNKFLFKQTMKGLKVPVVSGFKLTNFEIENTRENIEKRLTHLKFPVVIKPNNGGSSIGLFVAENINDFYEKIEEAFEFDNEVLIEKFINNAREFNVAILGNSEEYIVSGVDEPLKKHEVLSFSDKYLESENNKGDKLTGPVKNSMESSARKFPADIDDELKNRLQKLAKFIFTNLNLTGVVRIDFLYDENNNKVYVCEVNSIPGSLAFYFFNNKKLILNEFVQKLIEIAEKNKNNFSNVNEEFLTKILE